MNVESLRKTANLDTDLTVLQLEAQTQLIPHYVIIVTVIAQGHPRK